MKRERKKEGKKESDVMFLSRFLETTLLFISYFFCCRAWLNFGLNFSLNFGREILLYFFFDENEKEEGVGRRRKSMGQKKKHVRKFVF